jgi:hypothetical protein
MIDPVRARLFCLGLSASLRSQRIDRDQAPYLVRYFLGGWDPMTKRPGPALFLHHFLASDAGDALHSHPWAWSCSLILVGGYRETRCTGAHSTIRRDYLPGDLNVIEPEARHRIDLLEGDAWTLFLAGPFAQAWQFGPTCEAFTW